MDLGDFVKVCAKNIFVDTDDLIRSPQFFYQVHPCLSSFTNALYFRRRGWSRSFWPAAMNQVMHFSHVFRTSCDVPKGCLV